MSFLTSLYSLSGKKNNSNHLIGGCSLYRLSGDQRSWEKRFVCFMQGILPNDLHLSYWDSEKDFFNQKEPKRSLEINDTSLFLLDDKFDKKKMCWAFRIVTRDKCMIFKADNEKNLYEWKEMISSKLALLKKSGEIKIGKAILKYSQLIEMGIHPLVAKNDHCEIKGCGLENVNGTYYCVGIKNDALMYENEDGYLLSREFISNKYGWVIGSFPLAFYANQNQVALFPPESDMWKCVKGIKPLPQIILKSSNKTFEDEEEEKEEEVEAANDEDLRDVLKAPKKDIGGGAWAEEEEEVEDSEDLINKLTRFGFHAEDDAGEEEEEEFNKDSIINKLHNKNKVNVARKASYKRRKTAEEVIPPPPPPYVEEQSEKRVLAARRASGVRRKSKAGTLDRHALKKIFDEEVHESEILPPPPYESHHHFIESEQTYVPPITPMHNSTHHVHTSHQGPSNATTNLVKKKSVGFIDTKSLINSYHKTLAHGHSAIVNPHHSAIITHHEEVPITTEFHQPVESHRSASNSNPPPPPPPSFPPPPNSKIYIPKKEDWQECLDKSSNHFYYYNHITKESVWIAPREGYLPI